MTWILKHDDGQYLENVFSPDEHEPVCDFRDVPQRMAIRFGHRQAAKDARQVLSDRLGVRFRIVRLRRYVEPMQVELVDARGDVEHFKRRYHKEQQRTRALGAAVDAAAAMFDAQEPDEARLVLCAAHRVYLSGMRDAVSHEPGGIAYAARRASPSEGEAKP